VCVCVCVYRYFKVNLFADLYVLHDSVYKGRIEGHRMRSEC
jgi:hypothetical protein